MTVDDHASKLLSTSLATYQALVVIPLFQSVESTLLAVEQSCSA